MKTIAILLAGSVLLYGSAAQAASADLRKVTCGDFAKADGQSLTIVATWLDGYYMGNDAEAVIDFDKLNDLGNKLVKFCADNPTTTVSDAAEQVMGKSK